MNKNIKKLLGIFSILLGIIIILSLNLSVLGAVIGTKSKPSATIFIGTIFIIFGIFLFSKKSKNLEVLSEEKAQDIEEFIFKLAAADNISDKEATKAIKNQLKKLEREGINYFPHVFNDIDPDNYGAKTKHLKAYTIKRLKKVTKDYNFDSKT